MFKRIGLIALPCFAMGSLYYLAYLIGFSWKRMAWITVLAFLASAVFTISLTYSLNAYRRRRENSSHDQTS